MHELTQEETHDAEVAQHQADAIRSGRIADHVEDDTPWYQRAANAVENGADRVSSAVGHAQSWVDDHATRARNWATEEIHAGEDTVDFYSHQAANSIDNRFLRGMANVAADGVTTVTQAVGTVPLVATEMATGGVQALNHPLTSLGASPLIPGQRGIDNTTRMAHGVVDPVVQAAREGRPGEAIARVGIDVATLPEGGEGAAADAEVAGARGARPVPAEPAPVPVEPTPVRVEPTPSLPRNRIQMPAVNPADVAAGRPPPGWNAEVAPVGGAPEGLGTPSTMAHGPSVPPRGNVVQTPSWPEPQTAEQAAADNLQAHRQFGPGYIQRQMDAQGARQQAAARAQYEADVARQNARRAQYGPDTVQQDAPGVDATSHARTLPAGP